jgi:hypothetical protein
MNTKQELLKPNTSGDVAMFFPGEVGLQELQRNLDKKINTQKM